MTRKKMVHRRSWRTFRNVGLLWWVNRLLHLFGWAIVYEFDKGKITEVYPARCKFRGFSADVEEKHFRKLTKHLRDMAGTLLKEANE